MPSSIQSVEDLINVAIKRIGVKDRVGSIYEGSKVSKLILDLYAQTRDEFLRAEDFDFAERNMPMTLLKSAPAGGYFNTPWDPTINPSPPWFYEYAYPTDCLKVRALKPTPLFVMEFDPQPFVFSIENDNFLVTPAKVILCNIPPQAIITYTGQVTDLTAWEPDSLEAFAAALARRLAPTLANMDAVKLEASDEQASAMIAENTQG